LKITAIRLDRAQAALAAKSAGFRAEKI